MDQKSFVGSLYDAVDLIRMLEHLSDSCRRNPRMEIPWGGIALTLAQTRELVSHAVGSVAVEPAMEAAAPGTAPEEQNPNGGGVRELVDDNYYEGTFNRVQLTREPTKDPLEH